mmetsp:Transcript_6071/g.22229  ORF Transcript_6071/g.22229 Transcript_6071/m.22229 type:complete len:592 (+) Transcript_6071:591-2366(+)
MQSLTHAKRVLREVCILRRMHHTNIICLYDVFVQPSSTGGYQFKDGKLVPKNIDLYLVTELADGDLTDITRKLNPGQVKAMMHQIVSAVRFLHSRAVWHRDVKTANVLLCSGHVKLCDFGLARSAYAGDARHDPEFNLDDGEHGDVLSMDHDTMDAEELRLRELSLNRIATMGKLQLTGTVCTPCYRAPEVVISKGNYTAAMDMWGAGCIFWELLQRLRTANPKPLFSLPLSSDSPTSDEHYRDRVRGKTSTNTNKKGNTSHPDGISARQKELDAIFDVIGTPSWKCLGSIKSPHWREYLHKLPGRPGSLDTDGVGLKSIPDANAVDLLRRMLAFDASQRCMAEEALNHWYFSDFPAPPELPPMADNSLWGAEMSPPPPIAARSASNCSTVTTRASHGPACDKVDIWEVREIDKALGLLELELQEVTSNMDQESARRRVRWLLERECHVHHLQEQGFFFGAAPKWWHRKQGKAEPSELISREEGMPEDLLGVGKDLSEGLFCRWKDGWPEKSMEDEGNNTSANELGKRLKEVKWSDGWPSENLSTRTPPSEPDVKRSKSDVTHNSNHGGGREQQQRTLSPMAAQDEAPMST